MTKEEAKIKFNKNMKVVRYDWTDEERDAAFRQDLDTAIIALGLEPDEDGKYQITLADIHGLLD